MSATASVVEKALVKMVGNTISAGAALCKAVRNPITDVGISCMDVAFNTNECTVVLKHCGGDKGVTCGASGLLEVAVTSRVRTPVRVEFRYRRPWEKDEEPWKTLRLVVNTVGSGQRSR